METFFSKKEYRNNEPVEIIFLIDGEPTELHIPQKNLYDILYRDITSTCKKYEKPVQSHPLKTAAAAHQ